MGDRKKHQDFYCQRCMGFHPLHYTLDVGGHKHLILECPRGLKFLPMVEGLDIPVKESKRVQIEKRKANQPELL